MRDALRKNARDYRKEEWVASDVEPACKESIRLTWSLPIWMEPIRTLVPVGSAATHTAKSDRPVAPKVSCNVR
jgi:hypothetical protein